MVQITIQELFSIEMLIGHDKTSTSKYCVFIGGNLISWKSKKENVVARSSAEAEYRVKASVTCELVWLIAIS